MSKSQMYYDAVTADGMYRGRIYQYKADGNTIEVVWRSEQKFGTPEAAEDAACEYAEENGLDVELG